MAFKTFAPGVLTASDINTFMMRQMVTVFDDAAARDTAIPARNEGMIAYLKDTNELFFYDGTAWRLF